jgi:hypothetical protein
MFLRRIARPGLFEWRRAAERPGNAAEFIPRDAVNSTGLKRQAINDRLAKIAGI